MRLLPLTLRIFFFFFNDTATTEIYTLSLHDALPIFGHVSLGPDPHTDRRAVPVLVGRQAALPFADRRSEEHTSELQSHLNLVCRLLLEKKKTHYKTTVTCPHRTAKYPTRDADHPNYC